MIPVTVLEQEAGVSKNRIRMWAKRRPDIDNHSFLTKGNAISALMYLSEKEPGNAPHYHSLISKINRGGLTSNTEPGNTKVTEQLGAKITATVTDTPEPRLTKGNTGNESNKVTPGNSNSNANINRDPVTLGNGNSNVTRQDSQKITNTVDVNKVTGNAVVKFLRGSFWKGILALTAVIVSADYLAVFVRDAAKLTGIDLLPWIPYAEAIVFSVVGVTLAASNREKRIFKGKAIGHKDSRYYKPAGKGIPVANLWLFLFFVIEVAAMFSAWGVITNETVKISILAAMPSVSLFSFAHLFVANDI